MEKVEKKEIDMLKANDELIRVGISMLMETIDLNSVDVISNVERFESNMEILLEEYFKLHAKIKGVSNTPVCFPQNSMTSRIA